MIITEEQKLRLKELLSSEEYKNLISKINDSGDFLSELDDLIISRFDENDENTPDSERLQRIFDEIYNQNRKHLA